MVSSFTFTVTILAPSLWHGEMCPPRCFWNFEGSHPAARFSSGCVGAGETTRLLLCQHQGHWLWSQQPSCSVSEPYEGWAALSGARGTASLTTSLLLFSNASITTGRWITDRFFEMGLNMYFCKNCQGFGLGWGWRSAGCCLGKNWWKENSSKLCLECSVRIWVQL